MSKDLRIIFMGTPEFAVASLRQLHEHGFNVVAVITAPDKPRGRGRKPAPSAVKEAAQELNLKVLQPTNLKDPIFLEELQSLEADLQIVVAFRMLPEKVWAMPPLGTFNLHASLLPAYRGAAPINWAIINGEKETGITTFFLQHEIDTGEIILQETEPISDQDTVGDLYNRLMNKGAMLVVKTARLISQGEVTTTAQRQLTDAPKAPKIFRETCEIDFKRSTREVYNFVRGLSPYPSAWTKINGAMVKILKCIPFPGERGPNPGESMSDQKSYWHIGTNDGYIAVEELQWEGKRRMDIKSFLLGNTI